MEHNRLENSSRGGKNQTTWAVNWEIYMQVRKQHLEQDMEQQIVSN